MLSFVVLVYIANHGEYHVCFVPSDLANGDDTRYGTTAPTNDNPRTTHPRTCATRKQALPPTDDNSAPTNGNPAPTNNAATTHGHNNPPPTNRERPRTTCSRSIAPHPRTLHRTRTSPPPRNDNSAPRNDNPAPTNNAATSAHGHNNPPPTNGERSRSTMTAQHHHSLPLHHSLSPPSLSIPPSPP
ncbi:hypothetical protein K443DRAFT_4895 [Laccaria amethystina LaAM-08-1]|uniref:Uncharacterized protein n=1 Tax=Laccaria amethystina LaAM-08-1 TaxID=1095629 RepID=A0A0C9XQZ5_9AGAR|nr:hypothetical protein K443DRAFT_4895 [Laccaria amethystina LaAM-08-1]